MSMTRYDKRKKMGTYMNMRKKKIKKLLKKWEEQADKYFTVAKGKQLTWQMSLRFESMATVYEKCIKDLKRFVKNEN